MPLRTPLHLLWEVLYNEGCVTMYTIYSQEVVVRKYRDCESIKWEDTIKKGCKEGVKPKDLIACYENEAEAIKAFCNIRRANPKFYPQEEFYGAYKIVRFREWALYVEDIIGDVPFPDINVTLGNEEIVHKSIPMSIGFSIWKGYWNNFDEKNKIYDGKVLAERKHI